ncbi:MAG: DUF2332 domain-containing protein [Planctomycetota bacterium]
MPKPTQQELADLFLEFGDVCEELGSPCYGLLSRLTARNSALLGLAAHASRPPAPNVFLAAVHYLVLNGSTHPLSDRYAALTRGSGVDESLSETFTDFCCSHAEAIKQLVATRIVQTNEVNRSTFLAPALSVVYRESGARPLALVEIGASAGLNLFWDRYRIDYPDGGVLGDPGSELVLSTEMRGTSLPPDLPQRPEIASRTGLDLSPIDITDRDQRAWLHALLWPDQRYRKQRLDKAIEIATREGPPAIVRGDALLELRPLLAAASPGAALCVYNSSVLYQFTPPQRDKLKAVLAEASAERPLWHVSAESEEGLILNRYEASQLVYERTLAEFDPHGRWLQWMG